MVNVILMHMGEGSVRCDPSGGHGRGRAMVRRGKEGGDCQIGVGVGTSMCCYLLTKNI